MKKVMKLMMMAMAAIVLCVGFAACSSDDDDDPKTPDTPKVTTGTFKIELAVPADILTIADLSLNYTDAEGKQVTEAITSTTFKKEVNFKKLPATEEFSIAVALKSDYTKKAKYDMEFSGSYQAYKTVDGKATSVTEDGIQFGNKGILDSKLEQYMSEYLPKVLPHGKITIQ